MVLQHNCRLHYLLHSVFRMKPDPWKRAFLSHSGLFHCSAQVQCSPHGIWGRWFKSEAWRAVPGPTCWVMPSVAARLSLGKGCSPSPHVPQQHTMATATPLLHQTCHFLYRMGMVGHGSRAPRVVEQKLNQLSRQALRGQRKTFQKARESHVQISGANKETKEHRH